MKPRKIKINFTDFWPGAVEDNWFYHLLSKKFQLEITEKPDFLIYSEDGKRYKEYDCIRISYVGENRSPNFFECDYAFSFDLPTTDRNYGNYIHKCTNSPSLQCPSSVIPAPFPSFPRKRESSKKTGGNAAPTHKGGSMADKRKHRFCPANAGGY